MPSSLSLNFAAAQRSLTTRNPVLGIVLLLAGFLAFGFAFQDYRKQADENAGLQHKQRALHKANEHMGSGSRIFPEVKDQAEQASAAYASIRTPWDGIFAMLEAARGSNLDTIALLSLKANPARRELLLVGEAKNFSMLSSFTSALSSQPGFRHVTLANDKLSEGKSPQVVTFDLRLEWLDNPPQ